MGGASVYFYVLYATIRMHIPNEKTGWGGERKKERSFGASESKRERERKFSPSFDLPVPKIHHVKVALGGDLLVVLDVVVLLCHHDDDFVPCQPEPL